MGVHISKVRSIALDAWTTELLDLMLSIGNTKFNALYEGALQDNADDGDSSDDSGSSALAPKPTPNSTREQREDFIILKYNRKAFLCKSVLSQASLDPGQHTAEFLAAAERDDIQSLMELFSLGVKVDDCVRSSSGSPNPPAIGVDHHEDGGVASSSPSSSASPSPSPSPTPSPASPTEAILGTRALHVAARHDKILSLEFLLQNNARESLLDEKGMTAYQVAVQCGSTRCQNRLSKGKK